MLTRLSLHGLNRCLTQRVAALAVTAVQQQLIGKTCHLTLRLRFGSECLDTVGLPAELATLSTIYSSQQVLSDANRHCGSSKLIRQTQHFLHTSARPAQGMLNLQFQQYWAFQCLGFSNFLSMLASRCCAPVQTHNQLERQLHKLTEASSKIQTASQKGQ